MKSLDGKNGKKKLIRRQQKERNAPNLVIARWVMNVVKMPIISIFPASLFQIQCKK